MTDLGGVTVAAAMGGVAVAAVMGGVAVAVTSSLPPAVVGCTCYGDT